MNSENSLHHDWVVKLVPSYWNCSEVFLHCFLALLPTGFFLFFVLTKLIIPPRFSFLSFFFFIFIYLSPIDMFLCLSLLARSFSMGMKKSRCWRQSSCIGEKKDCEEETRREKKGASHFFFPLYSFCFFFVFLFQQKIRTKFSGIDMCASFCSPPHSFYFVSFFSRNPPPVRFIASRPDLEDWSGRFRIIKSVCLFLCLGNDTHDV